MRWFALLTLIALVAAGCGGSEAEEVEATGSIAFTRDGQLWVMKADGTGQRALARDRAEKFSPAWSPDGRRIAYASSGSNASARISVINADGSGRLRLTSGYKYDQQSTPLWSPDGRTIAFHGYDDGAYWISSVGADGSGQRTLTPGGLGIAEDGGFAWSPDGRKIAFTNIHNVGVYLMNRDGSGRHLLARVEAPDRSREGAFRTGDVAWSPDGRRIACISDGVLWVVDAVGTRPRRLVDSYADKPDSSPGELAWSPDGRKIAFTQEGQIFVVNGDGSELSKLTDSGSGSDVAPVWSPDGRAIAFTSNRDGNTEIYVMDADGGGERNVSQNPLEDIAPAWSPRGQEPKRTGTIAFGRQGKLWLMKADGSRQRVLTRGGDPAWSPDGRRIAYVRETEITYDKGTPQEVTTYSSQLFVSNLDGSRRAMVSRTREYDYESDRNPVWSPDGRKIAFEGATMVTTWPTSSAQTAAVSAVSGQLKLMS